MWKALLLALQATITGAAAKVSFFKSSNPSIDVTLIPILNVKNSLSISGKIVFKGHVAKNETLVTLPLTMAGQPSAQYTNQSLDASDRHGPLMLSLRDDTGLDGQPSRSWVSERATVGPVIVKFKAKPREVQTTTKMGPLFDIRANGNGLLGSTWALVPLPPNDTIKYQFSLKWDLTHSPRKTKAIWTWGEGPGPVKISGTVTTFLKTFWAVGRISTYSGSSAAEPLSPEFGMYWLEELPFNITSTASFVNQFFSYSSSFWKDNGTQPYRVFIRHNKNIGTGGTALMRSFTFGWHHVNRTTEEELQLLLAHEITHNWPRLSGVGPAVTRYAEGTAEYYSLRLLWRNNQISTKFFLSEMNRRIKSYYLNSAVSMTDSEAYNCSWEIPDAQRIPYGRGLIYLTNVDAQLRTASNGKDNLDSLTLDLLDICRNSASQCTEAELLKLLRKHLGEDALMKYRNIGTGLPVIQPLPDSLGPCFEVVQTSTNPPVFQWRFKDGKDVSTNDCLI